MMRLYGEELERFEEELKRRGFETVYGDTDSIGLFHKEDSDDGE